MAASEKIQTLRALLGEKEGFEKKEFILSSSLPQGVPKGALIELTGHAKTQWILQFLHENKNLRVFWLEEKQSIFPTAISQRGIELSRVVFGVIQEEFFASLRKIIQSQVFEIVVSPSKFKDLNLLKALQLFSEKSNTTLLLLAKKHQTAWPIAMQLHIEKGESKLGENKNFEMTVIKNKYAAVL